MTLAVAWGAVEDLHGNVNAAADAIAFTVDGTPGAPTVALARVGDGEVVNGPFEVRITFSEAVEGFAVDDVVVAGGTLQRLTGSGAEYLAVIAPPPGVGGLRATVTIDVDAGAAADLAGDASEAAARLSVRFDTLPPRLHEGGHVFSAWPRLSAGTVLSTMSIVNDAVIFPDPAVMTFTGGTVTVFSGAGLCLEDYSTACAVRFRLEPGFSGAATLTVPVGAMRDRAGNVNDREYRYEFVVDRTPAGAPTVALARVGEEEVVNGPFEVRITFSEAVEGFAVDGVAVSGGTLESLTGSGAAYVAAIAPAPGIEGELTVEVAAGAAADLAGDPSEAAEPWSVRVDTVPPRLDEDGSAVFSAWPRLSAGTGFTMSTTGDEVVFPDPTVMTITVGTVTVGGAAGRCVGETHAAACEVAFAFGPGFSGAATLTVPVGAMRDRAGNGNDREYRYELLVDQTPAGAPTVALARVGDGEVVTGPFEVRITFSEAVTGFAADGVTVAGGTLESVTGGGAEYVAAIAPAPGFEGELTVEVAAGAAADLAGDASAAARWSVRVDTRAPVLLTWSGAGAVQRGDFTTTLSFDEAVVIDPAGLSARNGAVTGVTGCAAPDGGRACAVGVSPAPGFSGAVTLPFAAEAFRDLAGNAGAASAPVAFRVDQTPPGGPVVRITSATDDPVSDAFTVVIGFSETVTGFELGDLAVRGGTLTELRAGPGPGIRWEATITPDAGSNFAVEVRVEAGAVSDLAGSPNVLAAHYRRQVNREPPALAIAGPESGFVIGPFEVVFTFSEPVTGFALDDIVAGNGVVSALSGSGAVYRAQVAPAGNGTVTVTVNPGAVSDLQGNLLAAGQSYALEAHVTPPAVTLAAPGAASGTVRGAFEVTVDFGEDVTGFTAEDLTADGATVSRLLGAGRSWSATVVPAASGTVTVRVREGAVTDANGRSSEAVEITVTAALQGAALRLLHAHNFIQLGSAPVEQVDGPFDVYFLFAGDHATGFTADDISVDHGSVGSVSDGPASTLYAIRYATVTPAEGFSGVLTIEVGPEAIDGGNAAARLAVTVLAADRTPPVATIAAPARVLGPFEAIVRFDEPVRGFALDSPVLGRDLLVTNGRLGTSASVPSSGQEWLVRVVPREDFEGELTLTVVRNAVRDLAGNGNAAVRQVVTVDTVPPVLSTEDAPQVVNGAFDLVLAASEALTGFTAQDVRVSRGSVTGFTQDEPLQYTLAVAVQPGYEGELAVIVAAGAAANAGGDPVAAYRYELTVDRTAPTVAIAGTGDAPVGAPFEVLVTFSEAVTGFTRDDLELGAGGGTVTRLAPVAGSDTRYAATIAPDRPADGSGEVTLRIGPGAVEDRAGNLNLAPSHYRRALDFVAPVATIAGLSTGPVRTRFGVTFTFSEPVTGFDAADVVVDNGAVTRLAGGGSFYTAVVAPEGDGTVSVHLEQGAAHDAGGNPSAAAGPYTRVVDAAGAPTVALSGPADAPVTGRFEVAVTFSEPVTGFDAGGVVVTGGTAAELRRDSTTEYALAVAPAAHYEGELTVALAHGAAIDHADNPSRSATYRIAADTAAPTVAVTGPAEGAPGVPLAVTFTFSEPVTGFDDARITWSGGPSAGASVAALTAVSTSEYTATVTPGAQRSGALTVGVDGAGVTDAAGNALAAVTPLAYLIRPAFDIALHGDETEPVTADFRVVVAATEAVAGFEAEDLVVGNGAVTAAGLTVLTAQQAWEAQVRPAAAGAVTIGLAAGAAHAVRDSSVASTAAAPLTVLANPTGAAAVALTGPEDTPVTGPFDVTVTFTELPDGVSVDDGLSVEHGSQSALDGSLTGSAPWTLHATITPDTGHEGDVTVRASFLFGSQQVTDEIVVAADTRAPSAELSTDAPSPTREAFALQVAFHEPVTGLESADFAVTGGRASGLRMTGSGRTDWSLTITPDAGLDGELVVRMADGAAHDDAGNPGEEAEFRHAVDTLAPTVAIKDDQDRAGRPFTATFTFSEPVTGFEDAVLQVANGTAAALQAVADDGTAWSAAITPAAAFAGTLTVTVASGAVTDAAGNPFAGATHSLAVDTLAATAEISSVGDAPVRGPYLVTIRFGSAVTGFTVDDVAVDNGTAAHLAAVADGVYRAVVTPAEGFEGEVVTSVAQDAVEDANGNGNQEAEHRRLVDRTPPAVTVSGSGTEGPSEPFAVDVAFSESVAGFGPATIEVAHGTVTAFEGSAAAYRATITPDAGYRGDVTVSLPPGAAADPAGNPSARSAPYRRTVDTQRPELAITADAGALRDPFAVTFAFSEPVTGFGDTDVQVRNGAAGALGAVGDDATTWAATITPAADFAGEVAVEVSDGAAVDAAGNHARGARFVRSADTVKPAVVIAGAPGGRPGEPFEITVTFSLPVTGFEVADLRVSNGTAGALEAIGDDGTTWTATITPAPAIAGTVRVSLDAGAAASAADNPSTAASYERLVNTIAPSVTMISDAAQPVTGPFEVVILFGKPVADFELDDLIVNGGEATGLAGAGRVYRATITPRQSGELTVVLEPGVVTDADGNPNPAYSFRIRSMLSAVHLELLHADEDPSGAERIARVSGAPFGIRLVFTGLGDSAVAGFTVDDIAVTGGAAANLRAEQPSADASSSQSWLAEVTPRAGFEGLLAIAVDADVVTGGNRAARRTFEVDRSGPTVTIASAAAGPVSGPFEVTFTFSEAVEGEPADAADAATGRFGIGDVMVDGGSAAELREVQPGFSWRASITPAAGHDGALRVDVAAGAVADAVGNLNPAATPFSIVVDQTEPSLEIGPEAAAAVNGPFAVSIVFSESVTDFTAADLTVGNGAVTAFGGAAAIYTATVTPAVGFTEGDVTIDVVAGAATDRAGNRSAATPRYRREVDRVQPVVEISGGAGTANAPFVVRIRFSEPVEGFTADGVAVTNGTAGDFGGADDRYTALVTPRPDFTGAVTVRIAAGVATDRAGNPSRAGAFTRRADLEPPQVSIESAQTQPVTTATFAVAVTFSEPVSGLSLSDFDVGNGTAAALEALSAGDAGFERRYLLTLETLRDGVLTVNLAAGSAQDIAGNGSRAAPGYERVIDVQGAPAVTVDRVADEPVNGPFAVGIEFSEPVTGFRADDLAVANGTASGVTRSATEPRRWTATVTPAAGFAGEVTVQVPARAALDAAGRGNRASAPLRQAVDPTRPTVAIAGADREPVNATFPVTVTFSEPVAGFGAEDVEVSGGGVSSLVAESERVFRAGITPAADFDGDLTVDVSAGAVRDAAGNPNEAAPRYTRRVDQTPPRVDVAATVGATAQSFVVTFTFDEPVTGFERGDVEVTNGAVTDFGGSGARYRAGIGATFPAGGADGAVEVSVGVELGAARDRAGNLSPAAGVRLSVPPPGVADTRAPELQQATLTADGSMIVLRYDELLNDGSAPPPGAFTVRAAGAAVELQAVAVTGRTVELTTAAAVAAGRLVTVSYTAPTDVAAAAIEDAAGNAAASFPARAAADDRGAPRTLALSISPAAIEEGAAADLVVAITSGLPYAQDQTIRLSLAGTATPGVDYTLRAGGSARSPPYELTLEAGRLSVAATLAAVDDTVHEADETVTIAAVHDGARIGEVQTVTVRASDAPIEPLLVHGADEGGGLVDVVGGPFPIRIFFKRFGQPVGFTSDDVQVTNGAVTSFVPNEGPPGFLRFLVQVTPARESGSLTVTVPANVIDGGNLEASREFTVDGRGPRVTIASDATAPVRAAFTITISFDERVIGGEGVEEVVLSRRRFGDEGDVVVRHGWQDGLIEVTTGRVWRASVTPTPNFEGELQVIVPAGAADDAAGNLNPRAEFAIRVDTRRPLLAAAEGATVRGTSLVLNYDELLRQEPAPPASAFTVSVGASQLEQTPTAAEVRGAAVVLTLGTAVTAGQTVRLDYEVPGEAPIADAAGNAAAALAARAVTNRTGVLSADATLSALELTDGAGAVALNEPFAAPTERYTAAVATGVGRITVAATATDAGARVSYAPAADADGDAAGHQVDLAVGETEIGVTVTAADGTTRTYTVTVRRAAPNTAPSAANGTAAAVEDTVYAFEAGDFGFADPDAGDELASVQVVTLPGRGTLALGGTVLGGGELPQTVTVAAEEIGNLTWTPPAGEHGDRYTTFTFRVSDGTDASASAYTMTIDVMAVNDAPSAADGAVATAEDTAYAFRAADFGFADPDGDRLASVQVVTAPQRGTLALGGTVLGGGELPATVAAAALGTLTWTPPAHEHGDRYTTFTFRVSDGQAASASAYTMTIGVAAVNDAPVVASRLSGRSAVVGAAFSYQVPAGAFSDADGDTLSYAAAQGDGSALPEWLGFDATTRTFDGTPTAADTGMMTVRATASDGNGGTASATFAVTVRAAASMDAALQGLSLSAGTLAPPFAADTTDYTASVANGVATVTVAAAARDDAATPRIAPADADAGEGHQVALEVGETPITVTVTAADGMTRRTYTVVVTRAAVPFVTIAADATLVYEEEGQAGFMLRRSGPLDGSLTAKVAISQAADRDRLPEGAEPTRTVSFAPAAGTATLTVALEDDDLSEPLGYLTARVEAGTGYRAGHPSTATVSVVDSDVGVLAPTALAAAARVGGVALAWDAPAPYYAIARHEYRYRTDGDYPATWTAIPGSAPGQANEAGHTVPDLTVGQEYSFQVRAVAQTALGNLVVSDPSNEAGATPRSPTADATLSALSLSAGTLAPAFAAGTVDYTASVGSGVASVTVTATARNPAVPPLIAPADADTIGAGHQVALEVGETPITVTVTATDEMTQRTYTVVVTRRTPDVPPAPASLAAAPGDGQVTLSWTAPAGDVAITRYEHRYRTDGDYPETWTPITDSAPGGANAASVMVKGLANEVQHTFQVRAVGGGGAGAPAPAAAVTPTPGICDRTAQVRAAILSRIDGVTDCAAVTLGHLEAVASLFIGFTGLAALQADDFSNLSSLTELYLHGNDLAELPPGVFSGLSALEDLYLNGNELGELPSEVFSGLSALVTLDLSGNDLGELPSGVFSGLSALVTLDVSGNELGELPSGVFSGLSALATLDVSGNDLAEVPSGVFSGLSALATLDVSGNGLGELPSGMFSGVPALKTLDVSDNPGSPLSLTVSLEKVGDDGVRATAPTGAPFALELRVTVEPGSLAGGGDTLTIAAGATAGDSVTVTRTPGTTDAVLVDLGTPLPALPSSHRGYGLSRGSGLPATILPALPALPALSVGAAEAAEGAGVEFTVTLSAAAAADVTATWTASLATDDTAETGDFTDLSAATGTLTITASETTATFTVATKEDTTDEDDETFTVTLSSPAASEESGARPSR